MFDWFDFILYTFIVVCLLNSAKDFKYLENQLKKKNHLALRRKKLQRLTKLKKYVNCSNDKEAKKKLNSELKHYITKHYLQKNL